MNPYGSLGARSTKPRRRGSAARPRRRVDARKRRSARLHRWSWAFRKAAAARRLERFGLDVTGPGAADVRRVMRNARKAERA